MSENKQQCETDIVINDKSHMAL